MLGMLSAGLAGALRVEGEFPAGKVTEEKPALGSSESAEADGQPGQAEGAHCFLSENLCGIQRNRRHPSVHLATDKASLLVKIRETSEMKTI